MNLNTIKNLPDAEFPEYLHMKIMRKALFLKFRTGLIALGFFLAANLILLAHRIWIHVSETQGLAMLSNILKDFELSADYLWGLVTMGKEVLPISLLAIALFNIIMLYYVIKLSLEIKKFLNKPLA